VAVFYGRYWVVVNGRICSAEGAGEPVDGAAVVDGMDTLLCCGFVSVEADLRGDEGELQQGRGKG